MKARIFPLDKYKYFDSAYWGMGASSDGNIYFGLCSHIPGKSAGFFSFNPKSENIEHLFNVDEVLGNSHGKIHTPILEGQDKKLYFGTHFAYPFGDPSIEVSYEGGHILSYDATTKRVEDLGIAHEAEGILTIAIDLNRHKIYSLTVPNGYLVETDLISKKSRDLGKIPSKGSICRTIAVADDGVVYGSFESNGLFMYDPVADELLLKEKFFPEEQVKEWNDATRGGVNKIGRNLWRCVNYDPARNALYGIYSASSRSFEINCETLELKMFEPLVPADFGPADIVYPTLTMATNDKNIYYVPADGMFDYCRSDNLNNMAHLMCFNKSLAKQVDLGEIQNIHGLFGAAGAVLSGNDLYLLGASEADNIKERASKKEEELFYIKCKPFNLSLVKIVI